VPPVYLQGMPRQVEVSSTSLQAYRRITEDGSLTEARYRAYDFTFHNGPITGRQADDALGRDYHKRLPELEKQGVVRKMRTTVCPVTGQEVWLWDVTDLAVPLPFKKDRPNDTALTGRAKAIDEIKKRIPEKKRSCELRELLAELEAEPPGPPDVDPYALLDDV